MPTLTFEGHDFECEPGETVLDALLRQGVEVPSSCRAGACQACLLRAESGELPAAAQAGLKDSLRVQGYFLACACRPTEPLVVAPATSLETAATITELRLLSPTVLGVRLKPQRPLDYLAGQYIQLRRPDGLTRSYSLASLPGDGDLELHVRRVAGGQMSGWLFEEAQAGHEVTLRGPAGSCFYVAGRSEQPLLLAGTGTGLAPLVGICRDALQQGHSGPIQLFHGAHAAEGLYLEAELELLCQQHPNLAYHRTVLEGPLRDGLGQGSLEQAIASTHTSLRGWRGFVCGSPGVVTRLKKQLFLAGVSNRDILADAFLQTPSALASPPS